MSRNDFSWAYAALWAMPMVGAYLWATWATEPRWGWRIGIAMVVQVVVLFTADRLYGMKS